MAKQKNVTVGCKEYTLQHPGAKWYLECIDRNKNSKGVLQVSSYTEELLENVVVDPTVTVSDFDDELGNLMKLTNEIESFLNA